MTTIIVLAMHGVPPSDFPRAELIELFGLQARLEHGGGPGRPPGPPGAAPDRAALERRLAELDRKVRGWPRTPENDRFFAASQELATELALATGYEVVVGFNEFCAPDLAQALDEAAARGAERVVVTTPMMTPGGEHAEQDIPAAIEQARARHPQVAFDYAWPFDLARVAAFLAEQIGR